MKRATSRDHAASVAVQILDTAPLVMRTLRVQLRSGSTETLSIPQFHALLYVRGHPGTGLSELADHLGATLPTMSELVNRLVGAGMLDRSQNPAERRRIRLTLTGDGEAAVMASIDQARATLTELLTQLPAQDVDRMGESFAILRDLLTPATSRQP